MKKIKITKKNVIVAAVVFLVFFSFLIVDFYFYNLTQGFSKGIFRLIPLPVAVVEKNKVITTRDLISNASALKNFYESQDFSQLGMRIDFSTKEGKFRLKIKEKEILDKLIESKIVEDLAQKFEIKVTKKEAQESLADRIVLDNKKPKEFALDIRELYNWSLDEFVDNIIVPELYLGKLYDYYLEELKSETKSFKKISVARDELNLDGSNFEEIVNKYSEGESAGNGGQLGWFEQDKIIAEVASATLSMQPGEISEIVFSSLGYHIVYLEDRREKEGEDGKKQKEIKIKQIFIRSGGFLDWLISQKREYEILILMKDYKWSQEETEVEFRSFIMQDQEDRIRIKSQGDPSVN